jgi:D-alanyl-D-alanine carboxypeptidase (penicillin-binding protein 5/6)
MRWVALGALVLVIVVCAVALRAASESVPPLSLQRTLAADVAIRGHAPALEWPREGEAAVEVEGVGSFGTSGAQTPVPIASVAKVMTAYLTLREHPLKAGSNGFTMTVTAAQAAEEQQRFADGQSTVAVRAGEQLSERQALEALLLPSANNVAAMLALHDAGSVPAFVSRMNGMAKRLRMHSTTYTDPSGFESNTVSTAADQLRLAKAALQMQAFAAIVRLRAAVLPVAGTVENYDGLVGEDGYAGVKTGSDAAAGGCFVFAKHFSVGGHRLIALGVVLGQRDGPLIEAGLVGARELGDSAAAAVRVETALPAGSKVLTAKSVEGHRTAVVTERALHELGWPGLKVPVEVRVGPNRTRLAGGERLATVTLHGASVSSVGAVAQGSLDAPSLGWRLQHLL